MVAPTRGQTKGNRNVDYAALRQNLTQVNPVVAQVIRTAVPRNGQNPEPDELVGKSHVNQFKLQRLSDIISNNINAATDLRIITPYIDKADLIWQTCLLYPNGKQDKILTRDTQPSSKKNDKLHAELLTIWDNYYTNDYKIEGELKKITSDILFNTGSYALFNLSRPGLDYLINGSEIAGVQGNESFRQDAKRFFDEEFITQSDGKIRVRNKGRFVRDPEVSTTKIGGLEAILGNNPGHYQGEEFNLMGKEDPKGEFGITITDNPAAVYLQKIAEINRRSDVSIVTGGESLNLMIQSALQTRNTPIDNGDTYTDASGKVHKRKKPANVQATTQNLTERQLEELSNRIFPSRNVQTQTIQYVKPSDTLKVAPYGRGLTWHVPSEAVIPIHLNGSNGTQIDFILLTDPKDGSFLKSTNDFEFYQGLAKNGQNIANKPKAGSGNNLIANLRQMQEGKECDFDMSEFTEMSRSRIIQRVMQSVISGRGDNISVQMGDEALKIFLSRMFRMQGVRCLYVPGESMTYMALSYNRLGIGQSLTQMAKMHIARLAAFDLADAMANLEAATPHTQMTINLNEKNPEPFAEIAMARQAFFETNPRINNILSTAQLSIPMIVDALRENSLTVKVNAGDNPHFPASDIQLDHMDKTNFKPVDDNSRQELLNKISNYFHLSKSWLDVSDDQNNFQVEALAEHQMLLNQVVNWQEQLGDFIADFERKHAYVNAPLMTQLIQKIRDNKSLWMPDSKEKIEGTDEQVIKVILTDFITNLKVSFPTPTSIDTTNKIKDSLDVVKDLVDKWVDMCGHSGNIEQIAKLLGMDMDEAKSLDDVKAQIKSVFLVEAFRRYNLPMPFDEIINDGKGGGLASMVNAVVAQRSNVAAFMAEMLIGVKDADAKTLKHYWKKIDKAVSALAKAKEDTQQPEGDPNSMDNPSDLGGGDNGAEPQLDDDGNPIDPDAGNTDDLDTGTPTGDDDDDLENDDDVPSTDDDENADNPSDDSANTDDAAPKDDADDSGDGTDPTKNDPEKNPFG